jgi:threonine dehydrogenase-like Zn-dependent dehydrogenase
MKAVCWQGANNVRVETVPDPQIINPHDAIIKVSSTAICGSDLHLYDGYIPTMEKGDILGHEFMGEVVDVGRDVKKLKKGDRVVVPFTICCGQCLFCKRGLWSLCDNSNPNAWLAEGMYGQAGAALYGYSHLYGGYAGGQAEYARVPFADVGPIKVPDSLDDEQVLFLSDIFPTAYQAAENCNIKPGDVVAIWGCGPVGLLAIKCAYMLGAARIIAIDFIPERLHLAQTEAGAEIINSLGTDVVEELKQMTGGLGPDACIDAVGIESHGTDVLSALDKLKQQIKLSTDRPHVLREAIQACGKGGTVSVPGVYSGFIDKFPMGAAFAKALTFKMGQTHVPRYMPLLLERIEMGQINPSFIITHRMHLEDAPRGYEIFKHKEDGCIKVVLKTQA